MEIGIGGRIGGAQYGVGDSKEREARPELNNSEYSLTNPDPSKSVRWGDQSFEEMMIGFMDTVPVEDEL